MQRFKRWLLTLLIGGFVLAVSYVLFAVLFTEFTVDMWWFQNLGFESYFWLRLGYRYLVFAAFTILFFLIFFLNFWIGSRYLGTTAPPPSTEQATSRYRDLVRQFRTGSKRVYAPFSLALAVLVAWPLYKQWEGTLLYVFGQKAGFQDPYFGQDISFYLFSLPLYQNLLRELLIALALLTGGLLLLYWLERRMLTRAELNLPRGAKIHLTLLLVLLFGVGIWWYFLQRYELLYLQTHEPLFYGPGFVEMRVILPLLYLTIIGLVGLGLSLIYLLHTRRGLKYLVISLVIVGLGLGLRYTQFLPDIVQRYYVKPNEISREQPFMEKNIAATLRAYNVHQVETREVPVGNDPGETKIEKIGASLRNIPVWDKEILGDVFQQLQELRTYYNFSGVSVDRYVVNDLLQQVYLAARELNLKALPPEAHNWINERLKYTHGFGVVMTPAAQGGEEPMTWFIQGIPPTSDYGFKIDQPAIYFGREDLVPVIAPNASGEMGYPVGDTVTEYNYQGTGGVPISNMFRKLIFAIYFGEKDIFFTSKTKRDSRMLFRRNIVDRIKTITPFFTLDKDPYIVVTPKGLYWIQDAYTMSNLYPGSKPHDDQGFNYIRNSVKIIVDAYNGKVDYYVAEPSDPIIQAFRRIYPGLLKSMEDMPAELKPHVRYPKDLFDMQLDIYRRFHQTMEEFYKQEDLWAFPVIERGAKPEKISPYYLTLNLINHDRNDFLLLCPMVPKARANLRAICVMGCDAPNYGKMIVYTFPKGSLFFGPSQVDAMIDQDTRVSGQLTLWNQMGSQVERGRVIVVPVSGSIVYIQPVYLKAAGRLRIPQLKRLIICKNETVVMEPTLEEGFAKLEERFQNQADRARRRLEELNPGTGAVPAPPEEGKPLPQVQPPKTPPAPPAQ
jgi:uncharacterized membrane protein (UPF0182 family)